MSLPMYIVKESPRDSYATPRSSILGSVCLSQATVDETHSVIYADQSIGRSAVVLQCLSVVYLADNQLFIPPLPRENGARLQCQRFVACRALISREEQQRNKRELQVGMFDYRTALALAVPCVASQTSLAQSARPLVSQRLSINSSNHIE